MDIILLTENVRREQMKFLNAFIPTMFNSYQMGCLKDKEAYEDISKNIINELEKIREAIFDRHSRCCCEEN